MKKFDKGHIYYSLISSLFSAFVTLLIFSEILLDDTLFNGGLRLIALTAAYLVIYLGYVVYAALFVKTSGYLLTETEIRCQKGVLYRKSSVLSFEKIHAVNKKQTLVQRIFGIATLTVDSGATGNAFGAEITIIEKSGEVDRLMAVIKRRQEGLPSEESAPQAPEQRDNLYVFSSRLKLIYSGLTVGTSLLVLLVLLGAGLIAAAVAAAILRSSPGYSLRELWLGTLFLFLLLLVLMSIVSWIQGIFTSFFGYHDFQVYKNRGDVEIRYGLFVRHTNNFKFRRIKAVKIQEGPVKRLFGFVSAGLEVVGYGNPGSADNKEQEQSSAPGMLLPLCRSKDLNKTLAAILPDYVPQEITHTAKSYPAFVLWPIFDTVISALGAFLTALTVLLTLDLSDWLWLPGLIALVGAGIAIAVCCFTGLLQYRNAGIALDEEKLTARCGALVRRRTVIRWKDIVGIERMTTPLRSRRGICSYKIHFFTNAMTNTVTVHNLDASLGDQLERYLKD